MDPMMAVAEEGANQEDVTRELPAQMKEVSAKVNADLERVAAILQSLQTVARKVESGDGTVGKLMTDAKLYELTVGQGKRLRLIGGGTQPALEPDDRPVGDVLHLGRLELRFDINRASWSGRPIDLTLTQFKTIALLALRNGEDVSYREIYDPIYGHDFVAGHGHEGYRTNVRSLVKRIRTKFRKIDPEFEQIVNYAGFGYRLLSMG